MHIQIYMVIIFKLKKLSLEIFFGNFCNVSANNFAVVNIVHVSIKSSHLLTNINLLTIISKYTKVKECLIASCIEKMVPLIPDLNAQNHFNISFEEYKTIMSTTSEMKRNFGELLSQ